MEFYIDVVCRLSLKNSATFMKSGILWKSFLFFVCVCFCCRYDCETLFRNPKVPNQTLQLWNCFRYNLLKVRANCEARWIINIPKCLRANYNEHSADQNISQIGRLQEWTREEMLIKAWNGMGWEAHIKSLFFFF